MDLKTYQAAFTEVAAEYERTVSSFGLAFEREESQPRGKRFEDPTWACENCGKSLIGGNGWISPGCIACRTGEKTVTFFISLACPKNCYFCFNPNQEDYERYCRTDRDALGELEGAHAAGARFDCIALTGGEPMLHFEKTQAFFARAHELFPDAHLRLYTSGYDLDAAAMDALKGSGLREIRFSVKLEDNEHERRMVEERIRIAVDHIEDVMVEMPVIPGALDEMKDLLVKLARWGAKGINLLEFCFPLNNADAFAARGFDLRRQPFDVLYNYWYAGGIPVAGSEAEALELLRFARERDLDLGVHYCSSDNKNTGQLFQQNRMLGRLQHATGRYLEYRFDEEDYLIKCAKAFGPSVGAVQRALGDLLADDEMRTSLEGGVLSFPDGCVDEIVRCVPNAELGISLNVLEASPEDVSMREVGIEAVRR
ncbi:radical SAM protein [Raoultibacter phocaeensis]|uniref:radical SAM protein n=1 Tax=Raoultibacter phocaeensis TaxID=2479841 RepID=UPI00111A0639|nr:radical SAM protein [Raoultibacter phocaeensis]